jgi:glycosyltransferase involved in cell wall biosynthesis
MQRIKLLYVVTKLELGGAQKQLLSLITNLDKERFTPVLFTAKDGLLLPEALSIKWLQTKQSRYLERKINPLKDILALFEIYRFIKENQIQFVHTHSSKAGILGRWAARLAKARTILHTVHGWSFNDFQPKLLRIFFIWLERLTAKFTDRLIVVSEWDRDLGLAHHIGFEEQYALIRYGIDYSEFSENNKGLRGEFGIGDDDLVVGMVSCLKPQKSPQDFIKLASMVGRKLPGIKFILVGDGSLRSKLQELILEYDLQKQVILAGWRRDIPRVFSTIDIFVLTSLWEGLPISLLEALVSSRPVIVTDTGGVREVITEGKNGFLVPPCDMEKMAQILLELSENENLRKRMQHDAKTSLGYDFSLENMVRNTENLYIGLLKTPAYVN